MKVDDINKLLIDYGANKKMEQILNENKDNFNIPEGNVYLHLIFKDTKTKHIDLLRLYLISFINLSYLSKEGQTNNTNNNITNYYIELEPDYLTNNIITLYGRNNINENISKNNAIIGRVSEFKGISDECKVNLCKETMELDKVLTVFNKEKSLEYINDIEKLFNLSLVKELLKANNTNTDNIDTDINNLSNILNAAGMKLK
jgi:hypothetical protein